MTTRFVFSTVVLVLAVLLPISHTANADRPPLTKKQLDSSASHIITGVVQDTYSRKREDMRFVFRLSSDVEIPQFKRSQRQ